MNFLYDHLDPAKSARKSRIAAAKEHAEQLAKQRIERRQKEKEEAARLEKVREKERLEEERTNEEKRSSFDVEI